MLVKLDSEVLVLCYSKLRHLNSVVDCVEVRAHDANSGAYVTVARPKRLPNGSALVRLDKWGLPKHERIEPPLLYYPSPGREKVYCLQRKNYEGYRSRALVHIDNGKDVVRLETPYDIPSTHGLILLPEDKLFPILAGYHSLLVVTAENPIAARL